MPAPVQERDQDPDAAANGPGSDVEVVQPAEPATGGQNDAERVRLLQLLNANSSLSVLQRLRSQALPKEMCFIIISAPDI